MESNHSSEEELDEIIKADPIKSRLICNDDSENQIHPDSERSSSSKTSCSTMSTSSVPLRPASSTDNETTQPALQAASNIHPSGSSGNATVRTSSRSLLRSPLREEGRRSRSLSVSTSAGPSPVQFSMTPPAHVKKPRRGSISPPVLLRPPRPSAPAPSSRRSSRAFCDTEHPHDNAGLPPLPPTASPFSAATALSSNRNHANSADRADKKKKSIMSSGRKRPRHSSRHQPNQRPCLDFEKMQQLKTQAVTSWRHGGEVSLFCW